MDYFDACLLISFERTANGWNERWSCAARNLFLLLMRGPVFSTISPMATTHNLYAIAIILQWSRCTACGTITFFLLHYLFLVFVRETLAPSIWTELQTLELLRLNKQNSISCIHFFVAYSLWIFITKAANTQHSVHVTKL